MTPTRPVMVDPGGITYDRRSNLFIDLELIDSV